MTRELLIPIARDVVEHAKAGTIKQAKEIMRLPATHYTDSSRFNTEVERLIKEFLLYWVLLVKFQTLAILKPYLLPVCH